MKPEYNVACFTALYVIHGVATCQSPTVKKVQQHRGPSHFAPFFFSPFSNVFLSCLPLVVSCQTTWTLCFFFGHGNLVKSESLELELESAKPCLPHVAW